MEFRITALDGESVTIEGDNWMLALGRALSFFDIAIQHLDRLVCAPTADGSVFVEDPSGGRSWMIRATVPAISVHPEGCLDASEQSGEGLARWVEALDCDQEGFWSHLLAWVIERIGCASASAALCEDSEELWMVGSVGEAALAPPLRRVALGEGLVGLCFDTQEILLANDVDPGACGLPSNGVQVAETSLAALCVPIVGSAEQPLGVLQLLNLPPRSFTTAQVSMVNAVSRGLAASLARGELGLDEDGGDNEPQALRGRGQRVSSHRG